MSVAEHVHERGEAADGGRGARADRRVQRGRDLFCGAGAREPRDLVRVARPAAASPSRPRRPLLYPGEGGKSALFANAGSLKMKVD